MAQSDSQQRMAEVQRFAAIAQTLNRATDLRESLEQALGQIVTMLNVRTAWLFLRDEHHTLRLFARHELPPAILYPGPAWNDTCDCHGMCAANKFNRSVTMMRCSRLRTAVGDKKTLSQHASVPIRSGNEVIGLLNVAMSEFARLTPAQTELLGALGSILGTAIERVWLREQVQVRRMQEQATLLQLSQDLLSVNSLEPALQRLVRVGARLMEADACAFVEADEQQGQATLLAAHGWKFLPHTGMPLVLDSVNPHLWYLPDTSTNLPADTLDDLPPLLAAQAFQGHAALALTINGASIGTFLVNSRGPRQFYEHELQLMGLLGSLLAQTLERERLQHESQLRQRLEQELDLARDIQTSFLPLGCPNVPGYHVATFYRAARQVGGDFYDFIRLPPASQSAVADQVVLGTSTPVVRQRRDQIREPELVERLGMVIADVTDKGVPAALFMALSRTLIRATASDGRSAQAVLEQANRLILADARSGLFVTAFYAILDSHTHTLQFASGGHNYPLLYRAATGTVEQLQARGLVLGIIPDPIFEQQQVPMEPGDVLCLYTDGVTEAMDSHRRLFDEHRLIEVLRRSHRLQPEQIIERIIDAVGNFSAGAPQMDDITLMVLKRETTT